MSIPNWTLSSWTREAIKNPRMTHCEEDVLVHQSRGRCLYGKAGFRLECKAKGQTPAATSWNFEQIAQRVFQIRKLKLEPCRLKTFRNHIASRKGELWVSPHEQRCAEAVMLAEILAQ